MKRKYTKHTKESLAPIVASSISYSECLKQLGLRPCGGNYKLLQSNIDRFELSINHMLHQAHNQGKELKPFDGLTKSNSIRSRLIKELGNQCQKCKTTIWNDLPVPLELEHIDGNNRNHSRDNVTLLCHNCHAQTPTWRNRKRV